MNPKIESKIESLSLPQIKSVIQILLDDLEVAKWETEALKRIVKHLENEVLELHRKIAGENIVKHLESEVLKLHRRSAFDDWLIDAQKRKTVFSSMEEI
jgi:hypothetical protein